MEQGLTLGPFVTATEHRPILVEGHGGGASRRASGLDIGVFLVGFYSAWKRLRSLLEIAFSPILFKPGIIRHCILR